MLLCPEADFRQVQDLTAFYDAAWDRAETLTALAADLGTVTDHFIWLLHHRERVSRMSSLTARTLSARTIRTPRQTPQPIRGGWLTARSTVFGQSVFEFFDPLIGLGQLLFQREQLSYQRFEGAIFFSKGLQFFITYRLSSMVRNSTSREAVSFDDSPLPGTLEGAKRLMYLSDLRRMPS